MPGTPLSRSTARARRRPPRAISPSCAPAAAARGSSACSGRRTRSRLCSKACSPTRRGRHRSSRYEAPQPGLEGRVDLRDLPTFTIDPETAKDFDDALSLRREGDGLRAYVHIADVAAFVPGRLAARPRRGGTRLLRLRARPRRADAPARAGRRSLQPAAADVDRLCVTVEVPFDGNLAAGEPLFYRSIIRSDGPAHLRPPRRSSPAASVRRSRSRTARARRAPDGGAAPAPLRARRAARREPGDELRLRRQGGVARAWRESEPHAHLLVEELMILANEAVAGLLAGRRRSGPLPRPRASRPAVGRAAAGEARRPGRADAAGARAACVRDGAERVAAEASERVTDVRRGVRTRGREAFPALVLRSLKRPATTRANLGHSGLASPAYCHFTSPIRRYPDLVVHRALLHELGLSDEPSPRIWARSPSHCSARERAAAEVEYRADEICLAWLLDRRAVRAGLGLGLRGGDRRPDRSRPLHPLRRGLRGLPARRAGSAATTSSRARSERRSSAAAAAATASATRSRSASSGSRRPRARSSSRRPPRDCHHGVTVTTA